MTTPRREGDAAWRLVQVAIVLGLLGLLLLIGAHMPAENAPSAIVPAQDKPLQRGG